jgi:peptide/nickel transport system permease protein
MKRRLQLGIWLTALGGLHAIVGYAGFFAPYDPIAQNRTHIFQPPTRIRFVDRQGRFHLRPFFYPAKLRFDAPEQRAEDFNTPVPLQFFVTGAPYRVFGMLPAHTHLLGADGFTFYVLGSDGYGRDVLSRILYGGQVSLLAGLLGAALALSIGLGIGAAAGYWGGWTDELLMRIAELFLALPWLYLLFAVRAFLPLAVSPLQAFFVIIAVIGAVGWVRPSRLVRGIVLSAKERDFVRAARGFGASDVYLLTRHVLPQTYGVVLTQAAMLVPQYVLAEMTLSFLGLGVPEPAASWGNLLSSLQQYSVLVSYWWMYAPAVAMIPFFIAYLRVASLLQESEQAS